MKKATFTIFIVAIICLTFAFHPGGEAPTARVRANYAQNIENFSRSIDVYLAVSQKKDRGKNELLDAHVQCRLAYKRIEYLLNSVEHRYIKDFINGPPLPRLWHYSNDVRVEEPEGLQVLDELVVEDPAPEYEIFAHVLALKKAFSKLKVSELQRKFTDRRILDAVRMQLIRILSLGITGFDTPGTLNGVAEARSSLDAMFIDFQAYDGQFPQADRAFKDAARLFERSMRYLEKNNDFDSFNRMEFIRDFLNPLYETLLNYHLTSGIISREIYRNRSLDAPINFNAKNPFSRDFLNPYYFMTLQPQQDNEKIVELGSYLFYEPVLSGNNQMSCATCHQPRKGFTDGLQKSISNDGFSTVDRNAPTVINSVYATRYFYDLRTNQLENQILNVADNPREFHTSFVEMGRKLAESAEYRRLFDEAFPDVVKRESNINQYTITTAIASYVKTLQSFDSPFDRYIRGETNRIDPMIEAGFNLFMGKAACGTCHFAPTFSGLVPPEFNENETEVLGVPLDKAATALDPDPGRVANNYPLEKVEHFRHSFKTVTVRNVALTAPYMHNGVYDTLEEVVDFYNRGGGQGMGLTVPFQTLAPDSLRLTAEEQKALIVFMEALTDTSYRVNMPEQLPAFSSGSTLSAIERRVDY
jgi:cytochrome c peroxidase